MLYLAAYRSGVTSHVTWSHTDTTVCKCVQVCARVMLVCGLSALRDQRPGLSCLGCSHYTVYLPSLSSDSPLTADMYFSTSERSVSS